MNNIQHNNFSSIGQMTDQLLKKNSKSNEKTVSNEQISFQEILNAKNISKSQGELKFSRHANERLISRNIDLSDSQLKRLENGTEKAREKGINESLVMIDNMAFIVNVKNNTVITAVNDKDEKVFTNIDGAVIN